MNSYLMLTIILVLIINQINCSTKTFKIALGFIYCNESNLKRAQDIATDLNSEKMLNSKSKILIDIKSVQLRPNENAISISLAICNNLLANLYALILTDFSDCLKSSTMDDENNNHVQLTLSAIAYTCGYYQIPVFDLINRNAMYADKTIYNTYVRMAPTSYQQQALIWIELLKYFEWKSFNLIYSSNDDDDGKQLAARMQLLAFQNEINCEAFVEFNSNEMNFEYLSEVLMASNSKVFLLYAEWTDIENILKMADKYQLTSAGNVWIVNDEILKNIELATFRNGLIFAQYEEEIDLLYNSIAITKQIYESYNSTLLSATKPNTNCSENGLSWTIGVKFYDDLANLQTFEFDQKKLEFNEERERVSSKYKLFNIKENSLVQIGQFSSNLKSSNLNINEPANMIWPGNTFKKPDGTKWSSKLRIVVIEEKPFIFKFKKPKPAFDCQQLVNNSIDCPWSNDDNYQEYCCYGYCIDLIRILAKQLNFEYEIYLVPDGLYGDLISSSSSNRKQWNGLMKELLTDKADLILAPFTITPERASFVDFTKPFKYQGITILVKRTRKDSNLVSFLQPFKQDLWLMILFSIHVVALVLYLLDRFSPFAHFKLSNTMNGETEEDALNLSRAVWFTWGVLFNSGIGEGTPRSFSARVLGMVWAGFAMIMVSSYTANLAAFLVLDRPESSLTGINDARLRNNQENYTYATVKGSSVERYFKRQIELSTMYRVMEGRNYLNVDDAVDALRKDEIKAFIWDSARLEYESRYSCEFICTGELFGRSSYALALKKGNPWLMKMSQQILVLHETGVMEELDKKWILLNNTYCQQKAGSTLGLTNMAGVFMLVAGGIILGIFLIFIEIAYKKHKDKKMRRHVVSRKAFTIWRKKVEKSRFMKMQMKLKQNHHQINNNDYF